MVTDEELAYGYTALNDFLAPPEGVEYIAWDGNIPPEAENIRVIGLSAVVLTEGMAIMGENSAIMTQTTNRALYIDRDSEADQRAFSNTYKQCVLALRKVFGSQRAEVEYPDEPDNEAAIVDHAAFELGQQGVITLGGLCVVEAVVGGKPIYIPNPFCAATIVQNLSFDMRESMMKVEQNMEASDEQDQEPPSENEQQLRDLIKFAIERSKRMDTLSQTIIGQIFLHKNLADPKDIRKRLGFAPPKR